MGQFIYLRRHETSSSSETVPNDKHDKMSISFPKTEEETLRYWREIEAFQTQLRLTEGCPRFTFYDGPPFGMPRRTSDRCCVALGSAD